MMNSGEPIPELGADSRDAKFSYGTLRQLIDLRNTPGPQVVGRPDAYTLALLAAREAVQRDLDATAMDANRRQRR